MDPATIFALIKVAVPAVESVVLKIREKDGTLSEQELYDEADARFAAAAERWKAAIHD